jgi:hypothetical protein
MKSLLVSLVCLFLCQCNSVKHTGTAPQPPVTRLALVKNSKIHMSGLQPEMVRQIQGMGIQVDLVDSPPAGDVYYLTYTAHWAWDLAMYLKSFQAELHRGTQMTGRVVYKTSGLDMNKFGHTDNKIRPLLRQLLLGEKPGRKH